MAIMAASELSFRKVTLSQVLFEVPSALAALPLPRFQKTWQLLLLGRALWSRPRCAPVPPLTSCLILQLQFMIKLAYFKCIRVAMEQSWNPVATAEGREGWVDGTDESTGDAVSNSVEYLCFYFCYVAVLCSVVLSSKFGIWGVGANCPLIRLIGWT